MLFAAGFVAGALCTLAILYSSVAWAASAERALRSAAPAHGDEPSTFMRRQAE